MHARLFTGFAKRDNAADFPTHFAELILPGIYAEAGFKSLYIMKDAERGEQDMYFVLVLWEGEATTGKGFEHYLRGQLPLMTSLMVAPPNSETLEVVLRA